MFPVRTLFAVVVLAVAAVAAVAPASTAHAAQSYDNCTGFIDSLPAVIHTQGTWCLRRNLSTGQASGPAIVIGNSHVTIDCNHFKIGNLAAGEATGAVAIWWEEGRGITVRNCTVRGFLVGIDLGDGGHLIEDNWFDGTKFVGIYMAGGSRGSTVRRNRLTNIGSSSHDNGAIAIVAGGDVLDNTIDGVHNPGGIGDVVGIELHSEGSEASGNRIRFLTDDLTRRMIGIRALSPGATLSGNRLYTRGRLEQGIGIDAHPDVFCGDNTVWNFPVAMTCRDIGGNASN